MLAARIRRGKEYLRVDTCGLYPGRARFARCGVEG